MIEIIEGAWAAGETKTFMLSGEYIEVLEAVYPIDVSMMDKSGAQLSSMRNAEASFFSRPGRYEVVQIYSLMAQYLRLFIGSGDAGTRRSAGVVSVVDGNLARTLAGTAFMSTASLSPVTAANNAGIQLWNLAGSGKALTLDRTWMVSSMVLGFNFHLNQTQLATLSGPAQSKLTGGTASGAAQIRTAEGTVWLPTAQLSLGVAAANATIDYEARTPIVILPGWGLTIRDTGNVVHTSTVAFEHTESQR